MYIYISYRDSARTKQVTISCVSLFYLYSNRSLLVFELNEKRWRRVSLVFHLEKTTLQRYKEPGSDVLLSYDHVQANTTDERCFCGYTHLERSHNATSVASYVKVVVQVHLCVCDFGLVFDDAPQPNRPPRESDTRASPNEVWSFVESFVENI